MRAKQKHVIANKASFAIITKAALQGWKVFKIIKFIKLLASKFSTFK